jgi:hypothetical protein
MAGPKCWEAKDLRGPLFFDATSDGTDDVGVSRERQMWTVLLKGAQREENHCGVPSDFFDFRPSQIFQKHICATVYERA